MAYEPIKPRREDGHGSSAENPTHISGTIEVDVPPDDYALGEVLPDQPGAGGVLTFTFSSPVVSFWVAVVGTTGVCKVDHYGGTPSASSGIPVEAGGVLPIPEPATVVKIYAPAGTTVTVWGQRRA